MQRLTTALSKQSNNTSESFHIYIFFYYVFLLYYLYRSAYARHWHVRYDA